MTDAKRKGLNIAVTVLALFATVIAIITFSIGLPIYFRPFYYIQIEPLRLEDATGYSREEIIDGYDEVLDYLTRPGGEFGAGVFKYSEDGKGHFEDCKGLFTLNAWCYIVSLIVLAVILVLVKLSCVKLSHPFGYSVFGLAGVLTLTLFAVLGILVSLDFDRAFVIFHSVFFPGKDNWIFHPRYDEIILAMPEAFFMNSAILIASSVIVISAVLIVLSVCLGKKERKRRDAE